MPRIRTVKPELFKHEELFDAEQESGLPLRLVFIGLFTVADREGRFRWRPRSLKSDILPFDNIEDFSRVLDALSTRGFILKYETEGDIFGYIPTWKRHQVVNNKERASSLPIPPNFIDSKDLTREARVDDALATREVREVLKGKGKDYKSTTNGGGQKVLGVVGELSEPKRQMGHLCPEDFTPAAQHYESAASLGMPRQLVDQICVKMHDWSHANANRAIARKSNWGLALHSWIRNHAEQHGYIKQPPRSTDGIT